MSNIGIGYSTDKGMVTSFGCLNSYSTKIVGTPKSSIIFGDQRTSADVVRSFGLDVSLKGNIYPFMTGSLAGSYAKYIQESRYSQTFNFLYQINLGNEVLNIEDYGLSVLNPFGLAAYLAGPNAFREACGDQFIAQESLGARLYATVKLNFATVADRNSFSVAVGAELDLFLLTIDIQLKYKQMIGEKNLNLNIEVAAYQDGGDVIKLATIFNQMPGGAYYVMGCDVFDMAPCQAVINGIINYAKLDFYNQISYKDGEVTGFPSSIGDAYVNYAEIGLNRTNSTVTKEIAHMRMEMLGNYSHLVEAKAFLNNLLYDSKIQQNNDTYKLFDATPELGNITVPAYWSWNPDQIFAPIQLTLSKTLDNIESNILLLESSVGIPQCYQTPRACSIPQLQSVDYPLINAFKKAYQIVAICNQKAYNGYAFPIDKNVYQETARFENPEIYFTAQYIIELKNATTGEIDVSIVKDELTKASISCGSILPAENQDIFVMYEATMVGACGRVMCPDLAGARTTYAVFVEIETPV